MGNSKAAENENAISGLLYRPYRALHIFPSEQKKCVWWSVLEAPSHPTIFTCYSRQSSLCFTIGIWSSVFVTKTTMIKHASKLIWKYTRDELKASTRISIGLPKNNGLLGMESLLGIIQSGSLRGRCIDWFYLRNWKI